MPHDGVPYRRSHPGHQPQHLPPRSGTSPLPTSCPVHTGVHSLQMTVRTRHLTLRESDKQTGHQQGLGVYRNSLCPHLLRLLPPQFPLPRSLLRRLPFWDSRWLRPALQLLVALQFLLHPDFPRLPTPRSPPPYSLQPDQHADAAEAASWSVCSDPLHNPSVVA